MSRDQFQHLAVVTIVALLVLLAGDRLMGLVHPAHAHDRIVRVHTMEADPFAVDAHRLGEEARRMGEHARRMGEEARRQAEQMQRDIEQQHRMHGDRCPIEHQHIVEVY